MNKHTPGPWTYELDVVDDGDIDVFSESVPANSLPGLPVAHVDVLSEPGAEDGPPREQALANARLIAAAPDLYSAVESVASIFSGELRNTPYIRKRIEDVLDRVRKG